ncbi:hypothetical protein QE152_g33180 [Popillia japonica]|uniref:Microtubule-associated protein 1B/S N-terminal domain-containing protein n=1 Tax=Popillia japonica TaxID=7064 RepID=A0AAW1IY36_POPJA
MPQSSTLLLIIYKRHIFRRRAGQRCDDSRKYRVVSGGMEAVNGVSDGGGPPPPSPLTGCYLLIVIGEPHSQEHKNIILQRIAKGLLSWDVNNCLIDLEKELAIITEQAPEGEEARYGKCRMYNAHKQY